MVFVRTSSHQVPLLGRRAWIGSRPRAVMNSNICLSQLVAWEIPGILRTQRSSFSVTQPASSRVKFWLSMALLNTLEAPFYHTRRAFLIQHQPNILSKQGCRRGWRLSDQSCNTHLLIPTRGVGVTLWTLNGEPRPCSNDKQRQ